MTKVMLRIGWDYRLLMDRADAAEMLRILTSAELVKVDGYGDSQTLTIDSKAIDFEIVAVNEKAIARVASDEAASVMRARYEKCETELRAKLYKTEEELKGLKNAAIS